MNVNDVRQLVQVKMPDLSRRNRVLRDAYNVDEYRAAARRVLPSGIFDYLDGGSEDEATLRHNRAVFDRWGLMPSWGPVVGPDTTTTVLGRIAALPITLTPTGATRLFHPDGEFAVAEAAQAAGLPYSLAGLSTVSMEKIAGNFPELDRWFNVGLSPDKGVLQAKLDRCAAAGYRTIIVTVDTRALGSRERDRRNGFTAPPALTLSSLIGIASRPGWWVNFLRSEGIRFPNLEPAEVEGSMVTPSMWEQILGHSESDQGWDDVEQLRAAWPGKIILKGTVNPNDVATAASLGVDAVQLSNHGGRQLDHMLSPMDVIQESRQRVGDSIELYVDSGIRRGSDIVKAIALGADACAIGRPYLYGLAAAGTAGVSRVLEILAEELRRTMTLVGVSSIAELKGRGSEILRTVTREED
ncbi:L-lactate dehydrogenase (cytochrome) [Rhodoglobus vestalii]|uniref:L-lactate dehydrogenase (Cytochrome) n=1 Tax=Rhodoglobus vestalii TaxID=193384 RepID=A0A8H2K6V7_9MICO|nr:alpha-hydroxy acid oxidase [Rhodoglobus vestalii]TQO19947.1 L-lactate dehydrogenase (cytochrome) [Rhodoglobus vestalii]